MKASKQLADVVLGMSRCRNIAFRVNTTFVIECSAATMDCMQVMVDVVLKRLIHRFQLHTWYRILQARKNWASHN